MREKEKMLLKFFAGRNDWVTSFSISSLLGISVRSAKAYISDINATYPDLILSSRKGFLVSDKKRLAEIFQKGAKEKKRPQTMEDRRKFILCKLLLEQSSCDLDELAGELSISPATLQNELPRIKAELSEYELTLKTKSNQAYITGQEYYKKKLISKLIYEDAQDSFLSIKLMQGYLPNYDLVAVRKIIFTVLRERHYFMDEFSMMNLVLHIAITMERHQHQKPTLQEPEVFKIVINAHIQQIMTDVAERLHTSFNVTFTKRELFDFSLLIMTRIVQDSANTIRSEDLVSVVGEEVVRLVDLMQTKGGEMYNITLTNSDFTVRFSLHIKNLLVRLANNIHLRNPQMLEIKNTFPFIYDVSVYMASLITQESGYEISEDEISYIALHLGVLIEERKVIKQDVRACLLNPQYFYDSLELAKKIGPVFNSNLIISGVVSSLEELETYSDYDLIITTVPLPDIGGHPCVHISGYLNNKDMLAIGNHIEDVLKDRIKGKVEAKIKFMFREEFFYAGFDFKDQKDALDTMAADLVDQGFVPENFKQLLYEREKVSSSAYANIAMPHPLEMCAYTSAISISLHPAGIAWNNTRVNIVFLLAVNIRDRLFFKDIFDFITEVISDDQNLKLLLTAKNYDEFVSILVSFAR
jgi:Transcriptional antiterminator